MLQQTTALQSTPRRGRFPRHRDFIYYLPEIAFCISRVAVSPAPTFEKPEPGPFLHVLIAGLTGWLAAFHLAAGLSAWQIIHFRWREGRFSAFSVQVRIAYTAMLLLALWEPMRWLFWVPAIGTPAQVLFGYCTLARCLSLLPWNRAESLTWRLVRRTFFSPPVKGSILQGLPATS